MCVPNVIVHCGYCERNRPRVRSIQLGRQEKGGGFKGKKGWRHEVAQISVLGVGPLPCGYHQKVMTSMSSHCSKVKVLIMANLR